MPYPEADPNPDFARMEREVLQYWTDDDTFRASVDLRPSGTDGDNEFVLYDGPPFANGLPHPGNLLTGFVKDVVPRYQTMRGRRVRRRFGWDCHGLPVEMEVTRDLGLGGRESVLELGVGEFNEACRTSVGTYTREWRHYVNRQARWVDFDDEYRTLDLSYMESVMWAFKTLWERGLVYEGYRVLPYCWECETPLSNFETRLDDAYRDRTDPGLTVLFDLEPAPAEAGPTRLLVWTTTPWTLPSNLALAVDPDARYALFERDGVRFVVAETRAPDYDAELAGSRRAGSMTGSELVGRAYRPLFDFFAQTPNAFRVLAADFVTSDDGTGIVHIAPGFGEDDQRLCEHRGIEVVCPVDDRCRFTSEVPPYEGLNVLETNERVIEDLRARGHVVRADDIVHSYPHCWRTDTPLVYRAVPSWFVRVTAIKDKLLELNEQITWQPAHVRDGAFGSWLRGARDWAVSRNRFWGSPIPVWKSDDPRYPRTDVYGSLDEIERDFGVRPSDLHRPAIDALVRPNPDDPTGRSMMRRTPEVLDCWFESGSMPFAQVHYPFENREWFDSHFPSDFIVEYVGQTRGWFYTLHVMSAALFDKPPFRACLSHGVLLGSDGRKLSKRLGNYPDALDVFETEGADAMRWYLLASPILRGQDLIVDRAGVRDVVRRVLRPLWSAWSFFALYANADGLAGTWRTDAAGLLDRYVLAQSRRLVERVSEALDTLDLPEACAAVEAFLDVLNNWYIRRSRDRFWSDEPSPDKTDAYDTLYTVLDVLCRTAAPLLPMMSERVWRDLTCGRSVHLTDYPDPSLLPRDDELVDLMELARDACSAGLAMRKALGLRVRLPLPRLVVAGAPSPQLACLSALIAEEVNVRDVVTTPELYEWTRTMLHVDLSRVGPRLGDATPEVLAAVRAGRWERVEGGGCRVAGHVLLPDEVDVVMVATDPDRSRVLDGPVVVVLDDTLTPALEAEGTARDVIRLVQTTRRERGLRVTDRIALRVVAPPEVASALNANAERVKRETLADSLKVTEGEVLEVEITR